MNQGSRNKGRHYFFEFWREGISELPRSSSYNGRLIVQDFTADQLQKLGYTDIFNTRGVSYGSLIDVFAKKDGVLSGFLVTTRAQQVKVRQGVFTFAEYFGVAHLHIAWVKPDLSWWTLIRIEPGRLNYCLPGNKEVGDIFKRWCLQKGYPVWSREVGGLLRCPRCGEYKHPNEFYPSNRGKYKRDDMCKVCVSQYCKERKEQWKKRKQIKVRG